jgi:hypothetical protein
MPEIYEECEKDLQVGMLVNWYADGDPNQDPLPAMVTRVGIDSCCVNIFDCASYNMRIRDGVRHLTNPRCRREELRESGAWDFTPLHLSMVRCITNLLARVEHMERQLFGDIRPNPDDVETVEVKAE